MTRRTARPLPGASLLAGALLAASTTLAACGAGPAASPGAGLARTGSSTSPDAETASIVACYRSHGDPGFPGPVYDPGDGRWHFAISPGSAPLATQQACRHLFPQAVASSAVPQAQFQALVRLAECMRANGAPGWPDPSPDGSFGLPPSLLSKGPGVVRATAACQRYAPSGGLNVHAIP